MPGPARRPPCPPSPVCPVLLNHPFPLSFIVLLHPGPTLSICQSAVTNNAPNRYWGNKSGRGEGRVCVCGGGESFLMCEEVGEGENSSGEDKDEDGSWLALPPSVHPTHSPLSSLCFPLFFVLPSLSPTLPTLTTLSLSLFPLSFLPPLPPTLPTMHTLPVSLFLSSSLPPSVSPLSLLPATQQHSDAK